MRAAVAWFVWLALRLYVLIARRPSCTFRDPATGLPYLTRWPLWTREPWPDAGGRTGGEGYYLHQFHRSDWTRDLHSHPAPGKAWILKGGYVEQRREGPRGMLRLVRRWPGSSNMINRETFHRTALFDEKAGSWSLFWIGPRSGVQWGFVSADGSVTRADHFDGRTGKLTGRS